MTQKQHIIVLGNEKGGTGKSTVSMHVIVSLLRMGFSVGSIDVDARQGTLTRYMENRKLTSSKTPLPLSEHIPILLSQNPSREAGIQEDQQNLENALAQLSSKQFVLIDTPGSDSS
ncbi:MAG: AAA family ATPase, partial [Proteobacteria bacterium]|nr:AAA family ATPase [Pseudomonadota bacterium]